MANRRALELERRGARAAKRQALERGGGGPAAKRGHLYLIFDDWRRGYSIRKLDLPSGGSGSGDPHGWQVAARASGGWEMVCNGDDRLPPVIFRVEAQRGLPTYFAAAFDTKILAMQPPMPPEAADALPSVLESHFPIFDIRTRGCFFARRMETTGADPIYIPTASKLFAIAAGTFDQLDPVNPPLPLARQRPAYGEEARDWSWLELPDPPFKRRRVTSYAVHPDDHTIFVSITKGKFAATITVDTTYPCEWKWHGKWALPFTGRAHYDLDLDAWVGLAGDPDSIGHLCACNTVTANPDAGGDSQCPARKLSKEKLLRDDPTERHVGATLVYAGSGSEFCLVQCVSIQDDRADEWSDGDLEDVEYDSGYNDCDLEDDYDDDLLDGCCGCCVEDDGSGDGCCVEDDDGSADECKEDEQDLLDDCCICCVDEKKDDGSAADCKEDEQEVTSRPRRYLLRLTTFTLKYDKDGDLTTGGSCRVLYCRVPKRSTVALLSNPVAFWM